MLDIFPVEIWLNIFKQTSVEDLFKKREVCRGFKEVIDKNLKHFYLNYSRQYPSFFSFKKRVFLHDFIVARTKIFITNFSKYPTCHSNFIKALISENISLKQAKLILYLNQSRGFNWWYALQCISMNEAQLNQTFKLIDISVSQANAIRISKQNMYTERQFNIFSDLFFRGISDYYSDKLALTFTQRQLDRFYFLLDNTDYWWLHIIWMIEEGNV